MDIPGAPLLPHVLLTMLTGGVSLALTGAVRAYAVSHAILDHPNARSSHTLPTPRGGGVAVVAASALGLIVGAALGLVQPRDAIALGVGMIALAVVGFVDDARGLKARTRLFFHLVVAGFTLVMFGGFPGFRVGQESMGLGWAGFLIGAVGIVWSINLFNFMDGIDGLAGSQAVLILGVAGLLLVRGGEISLGTVSLLVAAGAAGFVVWNWPPAKIFMGDVGSGSIGYLMAGLAVGSENRRAVPLLVFAMLGGVFILDATVTLARRFVRRERLSEAHRDHAYQRLARSWGSHRPVTLAAGAVTLALAGLAACATASPGLLVPATVGAFGFLAALFAIIERRAPM